MVKAVALDLYIVITTISQLTCIEWLAAKNWLPTLSTCVCDEQSTSDRTIYQFYTIYVGSLVSLWRYRCAERFGVARAALKKLESLPVTEQLTGINQFFNQTIRWQSITKSMVKTTLGDSHRNTRTRQRRLRGLHHCQVRKPEAPRCSSRSTQTHLRKITTEWWSFPSSATVLAWYAKAGAVPLILDNANTRIYPHPNVAICVCF